MAVGAPKTVAGGLIDRLNELRRNPNEAAEALGQIRFSARGLKKTDYAAFLAVTAMIAAIERNVDELDCVASELEAKYPDRTVHILNVLRSYATLNQVNKAVALAQRIAPRLYDPTSAWKLTDCLLDLGAIEACVALSKEYANQWQTPIEESRHCEVAMHLIESGMTSDRLIAFLGEANSAFAGMGFPLPLHQISLPVSRHGEGDCYALARFYIPAAAEDLAEIEDAFFDAMIASGEAAFVQGEIACSVMSNSRDD